MIGYRIPRDRLRKRIESEVPGWLEKAATRTERFRDLGRYDESSPIWKNVKRVYMDLQGYKCGFCERRLENSQFGSIEHDVEHFRPKKSVEAWPSPSVAAARNLAYTFALSGGIEPGYYLLPYHHLNYLVSCKTCNTALKGNAFPVADGRNTTGEDPQALQLSEKPFVIYPISTVDKNPEFLIRFEGVIPVPVNSWGHGRRRAQVTIDLFQLATREGLLQERAERLATLYLALLGAQSADPPTAAAANALVSRLIDPLQPHANCTRSFHDMWSTHRADAEEFGTAAVDMLSVQP